MSDETTEQLRAMLANVVAMSEASRLEAAERHAFEMRTLELALEDCRADKEQRVNDLLDIIHECHNAIRNALPLTEPGSKYPYRTIAERAATALLLAGRENVWTEG